MSKQPGRVLAKSKFRIAAPVSVRKSRGADGKEEMLIAGICSAETLDRDKEIAFQKGLDFRPFLSRKGAFNIDHDNSPGNIVGIGKSVKLFQKGERLPDGSRAQHNLSWVEGTLLATRKGREIFETCRELGKHQRGLFLSLEGSVLERAGKRSHILAKAEIERIAVTSRPVCEETSLMTKELATRLLRASRGRPNVVKSTSAMQPDGKTPNVLVKQDLARRITNLAGRTAARRARLKRPEGAQKSRAMRKALISLYRGAPHLSIDTAIALASQQVRTLSHPRE